MLVAQAAVSLAGLQTYCCPDLTNSCASYNRILARPRAAAGGHFCASRRKSGAAVTLPISPCGGAIILPTGKIGRYRYHTCSTKVQQGETGCKGRIVPMEKLDSLVADHIEQRLLHPDRLDEILSFVLVRREERAERQATHIAELRKRASEGDAKLKRL
jgi:hypothetical protein